MSQKPCKRRYRQQVSRPIPVWNGILEHRARVDTAIWVFLWLLDGITEDREAAGVVLGGAPIKASRIARDLDFDEKTVLRHLEALETGHYIRRRRTPYGFAIEVCNSRKFGIWSTSKRSDRNVHSLPERSDNSAPQIRHSCPERSDNLVLYKEDAAKNAAIKTAACKPAAQLSLGESVWTFLGVEPCGPIPFRSLLESRWLSRNGKPASVLIGETIDTWETANGTKPPRAARLFKALAELRQREKKQTQTPKPSEQPIHQLTAEEIPA